MVSRNWTTSALFTSWMCVPLNVRDLFHNNQEKTQQATIDNIKTRMHDAHLQCLKKTASGCSILCSTPRNQGIILYLMGTIWSCRCSQKKVFRQDKKTWIYHDLPFGNLTCLLNMAHMVR